MTITNIQAMVTKTAAFTGAKLDVSGITGDWTIKFQVESLSASAHARIGLLDNPAGGTAYVAGPQFEFVGTIGASYDNVRSIKKQDFPALSCGIAGGTVEADLLFLTAGASCKYHVWIEY